MATDLQAWTAFKGDETAIYPPEAAVTILKFLRCGQGSGEGVLCCPEPCTRSDLDGPIPHVKIIKSEFVLSSRVQRSNAYPCVGNDISCRRRGHP